MAGWVTVTSACFGCKQPFSYNPHRVPSFRPNGPSSPREPVCENCMSRANAVRVERGESPHPIRPGAYEPMREEEL